MQDRRAAEQGIRHPSTWRLSGYHQEDSIRELQSSLADGRQMSPYDLALAVLLAASFVLSVIVLVILALILEAVMFALGYMLLGGGGSRRDQ